MNESIPVIRPRQIFKLVEDKFPNENVEITITMPPSGIGSLLVLESSLLVALLKIIDAKNVFEIGTYNGNTTLLFANNTRTDALITSLDLPPEEIAIEDVSSLDLRDANQNDQFLRQAYKTQGAFYVNRAKSGPRSKIRLINEDSRIFSPSSRSLEGTQDLVFIDGGHDYDTIRNDSEKAFLMAKPDSIVVWHDYLSSIHTEVETYLRELAKERDLISIGSTMLCVCFLGKFSSLIDRDF